MSTQAPSPLLLRNGTVTTKLAWGYVAVVLATGLAWMIASPPGIYSDSVSGFRVMLSMEGGAAFNHTFNMDIDDISADVSTFTSWWTPGQYLTPMVFHSLGFDLGQSMLITVMLAWMIGVAGFWLLWRRLGFSSEVSAISLAVGVSQSYVLFWGRFYHGGELLQWSFFPWFILVALRCRKLEWHQILGLSAALALGIFFKSSFAILGSGVMASLLLLEVHEEGGPFRVRTLSLALRSAIAVAIAGALFLAYTSLGESAAGKNPWSLSNVALSPTLFALAGPLNSIFDLGKLYIQETEMTTWPAWQIDWELQVLSLFTVLLLFVIVRYSRASREYFFLLVVVYAVAVAAFSLAFALDLLISFNVRHFRIAGVLFIPGVVALLVRIPIQAIRLGCLLLVGVFSLMFTLRFALPVNELQLLARPIGAAGFSHIYASQAAVDALSELEDQFGEGDNNLVGVPWPQMALDLESSRVYNMSTALKGIEYFRHDVFFGRVDNLLIVLPINFSANGGIESVLRSFREHGDWRRLRPEIEDYVFMYSGGQDDLQ